MAAGPLERAVSGLHNDGVAAPRDRGHRRIQHDLKPGGEQARQGVVAVGDNVLFAAGVFALVKCDGGQLICIGGVFVLDFGGKIKSQLRTFGIGKLFAGRRGVDGGSETPAVDPVTSTCHELTPGSRVVVQRLQLGIDRKLCPPVIVGRDELCLCLLRQLHQRIVRLAVDP
jgi:hypothetical protein